MIDNSIVKVIERLTNVAQLHGTAYCKITWDEDKQEFYFTVLLKEHVTVHYGEKSHD